jgi:hypothetical protein
LTEVALKEDNVVQKFVTNAPSVFTNATGSTVLVRLTPYTVENIHSIEDEGSMSVPPGYVVEVVQDPDADINFDDDTESDEAEESLIEALASVALVDAASITPNFATARNFHVTLGGNRTLENPTNQVAGQGGRILITQDGAGGRTLAFGTNWNFPGGTVVLSTGIGAVDMLVYDVHASGTIYASLLKEFS